MAIHVLIIGAGPGGYPAAFHAADLGMRVTLVDPEANPGGVCLYRGCIPSKALLHVAAFLHEAELAPEWGLVLDKPKLDLEKLRVWKQGVVDHLTGGLGQLVLARKITHVRGTASFLDPHRARITPLAGAPSEITFDYAIVATGSTPALVPGFPQSPRIMTSTEALALDDLPGRLLVVGGGYIGVELGQAYAAFGSTVTLVEMLPLILPGVDRDLVKPLEKRLNKQFESILTETKVSRVTDSAGSLNVVLEGRDPAEKQYDKILVAVGRKPLTKGAGLENTAVKIKSTGFVEVDNQRRTAEKNIFAIGDLTGEPLLAHKATAEARVAVEAIAGMNTIFDSRAIPCVVFSDPEIAWCGLTQADAESRHVPVKIASFPWAASGRAATLGRKEGLTKLLLDPDKGRILGAGLAGAGAGELLAEAVLALEMGAVADDLALTIHTHPTLSETFMESAEQFSGFSTHYLSPRSQALRPRD